LIEEITLDFKEKEEIKPHCKKTFGYRARNSITAAVSSGKSVELGRTFKGISFNSSGSNRVGMINAIVC
jgi:hypothetical protein